jgi:branched-subunit amino acid permease
MTRAEVVTLIVKALGLSPAKDAKLSFKDSKIIPSWAQGYMKTALDKGFIKGYPDNTIKPMDKVTRAEFTVMVMKAFNVDLSKNEELKFKDAKAGIPDWAKQQIAAAVSLKIINGYKDNTFKANNSITRAEVGTIIARCFGVSGKSYPEL